MIAESIFTSAGASGDLLTLLGVDLRIKQIPENEQKVTPDKDTTGWEELPPRQETNA